ncbi:MAG: hypothetical protein CHACPFDD_03099 [Phycisphaerae bacterium]|nr:hypothetical protein [Phycisphaerae bacterium]
MYEISVDAWFAAAHQLRLESGRLEPLHGHNWAVRVTVRGPQLDRLGMLVDFTRLKPDVERVVAGMHDRCLNELPAFRDLNPSAENVARHVAEALAPLIAPPAGIFCVEVEESPGCRARYFPPPPAAGR